MRELHPEAKFADGFSDDDLRAAEEQLGHPVPDQLASVLRESDGILDVCDGGLIWSLERIVADNILFRTDAAFREIYMPFDPLLFFADAGNGDRFALVLPPLRRGDVFVWDHEDDSRSWGAANVEMYLRWSASGKLKT